MSYHQKEAKALKTVYCNFDISTKIAVIVPVSKLIKDNSQFQTIQADSGGGGGGGGGYTFHVATFWKDAYFNGSSLDICEIRPGVGYYIYYINNLQNYGFNDCLSSHKGFVWNSNDGPLKSTVYEVKVWKNCDRGGSSHTFTGDKSRIDNNWIDEQLGFPDYTTINDQVSSFEIKYRVENY